MDTRFYGRYLRDPVREEIEKDIAHRKEVNVDEQIQSDRLYVVNKQGELEYRIVDGQQGLVFTDLAMSQILNRFGIPVAFYKKNPSEIQQDLFEYWSNKYHAKLLMRFITSLGNRVVRAVLSDGYSIMDDHQVFPDVMEAIEKAEDEVHYSQYKYDEHLTQLLITFPDTIVSYNNMQNTAGMMISNSEVGLSSVWVEPAVISSNVVFVRRAALRKQGIGTRIVHRGNIDPNRVREMALQMKEIAQVGIIQLAEAWENRISGETAIQFVKTIDALPKRFSSMLEEEWENQKDVARAMVAMRILEMAKQLPLFQQSIVEQAATEIIGLFDGYKARMTEIMQELS